MLFPIFVILSLFAVTWPNFCVMVAFIISPRMKRWKMLTIAGIMSFFVFSAAVGWLINSAIQEGEQLRKAYGDHLPHDVVLNQDGYAYVLFCLCLMLGVALGLGLPMAAGFLGRVQPMLQDLE